MRLWCLVALVYNFGPEIERTTIETHVKDKTANFHNMQSVQDEFEKSLQNLSVSNYRFCECARVINHNVLELFEQNF